MTVVRSTSNGAPSRNHDVSLVVSASTTAIRCAAVPRASAPTTPVNRSSAASWLCATASPPSVPIPRSAIHGSTGVARVQVARRSKRSEIGHRSAADKKAESFSGESQDLADPIDRDALEFYGGRRRTPDRKVGVQRRSKQIGESTDRRAGRLHIAKHPGMRVLPAKRNDRVAKNFQQRIKISSFDRKLRIEAASDLT